MPHHEGEVLTETGQSGSLAFRLGLAHAIHPAYLSPSTEATAVREWLEANSMLREVPDAESTLGALAVQEHREQPFQLADQDLRDLRDMLKAVPTALSVELGPRIGRAVTVNVHLWTPPLMQAFLPTARCKVRSGAVVYPACWCGLLNAAGLYGDARIGSKSSFRAQNARALTLVFRSRLIDRLPLPVLRPAHIPDGFPPFALVRRRREPGRSPSS